MAADSGFTEIVERLLIRGANVNHQNKVAFVYVSDMLYNCNMIKSTFSQILRSLVVQHSTVLLKEAI